MGKELYVGTFVHSLSLNQLEIGENGVIGVEDGKIAFVEKNVKDLEAIKKAHNFEGAKVDLTQRVCRTYTDDWIDDAIIWMSVSHPWIHRLSHRNRN